MYLHDITRDGWPGSAQKNLTLFSKICGEKAMKQVSFVTTKWGKLKDVEDGTSRLSQLKERFWSTMIQDGASVYVLRPDTPLRGVPDQRRPWDVIHQLIVSMNCRNILLIQEELVNQRKPLYSTKAGKEVRQQLERLLEDTRALRNEAKEHGDDAEYLAEQQKRVDELKERLIKLKPGVAARFRKWFWGRFVVDRSDTHSLMSTDQ